MTTPQHPDPVAMLAYQIWEREGRPAGRDQHHWEQAQKQLQVEFQVGFPDATGDEDPDSSLSSSDSERAEAERESGPEVAAAPRQPR
jgi:hypothetical protein